MGLTYKQMGIKRMIGCAPRGGVSFYNLQAKRGIFLKGRGLSGILAGYLNYCGPNLPENQISLNL